MTPRTQRIIGFVAFAGFVAFVAVLPSFVRTSRRASTRRRDLPHRAPRPQHPHRLHGADLARPRRVHGHRRLHDRDPHGRQRAVRRPDLGRDEGRLDAPDRRARRRPRRAWPSAAGAAASRALLALATFAIAVAMPSTVRRFEEFTGGGTGIQLFGSPELTGSISNVKLLGRSLTPNDWMYYLAWSIALVASPSPGSSSAGGPGARSAPYETARPLRSPRA